MQNQTPTPVPRLLERRQQRGRPEPGLRTALFDLHAVRTNRYHDLVETATRAYETATANYQASVQRVHQIASQIREGETFLTNVHSLREWERGPYEADAAATRQEIDAAYNQWDAELDTQEQLRQQKQQAGERLFDAEENAMIWEFTYEHEMGLRRQPRA